MADASLNPIQERLNSVDPYHPAEAETFSDWTLEAGDTVTMKRGQDSYDSPIHTSRMVWKGAPQISLNSTGNKEREAIAKVSKKKYRGGSGGMRTQQGIFHDFYSEDGYLHSSLAMTESYLRTEFHDEYNSLHGELEMTASHLQTIFTDEVNSLRGEFEVTASHLEAVFTEVNSLRGEFEVTASHLEAEFINGYNSLRGEFEVTASGLRSEFEDGLNSLHGELVVTASGLRSEFESEVDSTRSEIAQSASYIRMVVDTTDPSNPYIKAAEIAAEVNKSGSTVRINANRIRIGDGSSTISLNDALGITSTNAISLKGNTFVNGTLTMAVDKDIIAGDIRATSVRFAGLNPGDDRTLNLSTLNEMVKTFTYNTTTEQFTVTLFNGSSWSFRRAAPSGNKISGSWNGTNTLSVGHSLVGEDYFNTVITTGFKCVTTQGQSDQYYIYAYHKDMDAQQPSEVNSSGTQYTMGVLDTSPTIVRLLNSSGTASVSPGNVPTYTIPLEADREITSNSGSSWITPSSGNIGFDRVKVNVPLKVTGSWNNSNTYTAQYSASGSTSVSTTVNNVVKMQQGECYTYATWESSSQTTPTLIAGTSKKLTIVDSGNDAVKLQAAGSDISGGGYTYTHNKYTGGWGDCYSDIDLNYSTDQSIAPGESITIYPAAKETPSATHSSITSKGITISADTISVSNWNLNTVINQYSYKPSVYVNGTKYTATSNVFAEGAYVNGWSKGLSYVELKQTPAGDIDFGTTYTITAEAYLNKDAQVKQQVGSELTIEVPSISTSNWSLGSVINQYTYKPSVKINGTTYTSISSLQAEGAYNNGWTRGQTGASASNGARIELRRTPDGAMALGTEYTITAWGYVSKDAQAKQQISGISYSFTTPSASYTLSFTDSGTATSSQISNIISGYDAKYISGVPTTSQSQVYRYIRFTVGGKKKCFYFS